MYATIVGYAARTDVTFVHPKTNVRQVFVRGCFQHAHAESVVLGINHQVCRCFDPGRSRTDAFLIDRSLVVADTRDGSLWLAEDAYGLAFAARIRADLCVAHGDGPAVNLVDAIRRGECRGVSIHYHSAERYATRNGQPVDPDVLQFSNIPLVEISISVPPDLPAVCPGTSVALLEGS